MKRDDASVALVWLQSRPGVLMMERANTVALVPIIAAHLIALTGYVAGDAHSMMC